MQKSLTRRILSALSPPSLEHNTSNGADGIFFFPPAHPVCSFDQPNICLSNFTKHKMEAV